MLRRDDLICLYDAAHGSWPLRVCDIADGKYSLELALPPRTMPQLYYSSTLVGREWELLDPVFPNILCRQVARIMQTQNLERIATALSSETDNEYTVEELRLNIWDGMLASFPASCSSDARACLETYAIENELIPLARNALKKTIRYAPPTRSYDASSRKQPVARSTQPVSPNEHYFVSASVCAAQRPTHDHATLGLGWVATVVTVQRSHPGGGAPLIARVKWDGVTMKNLQKKPLSFLRHHATRISSPTEARRLPWTLSPAATTHTVDEDSGLEATEGEHTTVAPPPSPTETLSTTAGPSPPTPAPMAVYYPTETDDEEDGSYDRIPTKRMNREGFAAAAAPGTGRILFTEYRAGATSHLLACGISADRLCPCNMRADKMTAVEGVTPVVGDIVRIASAARCGAYDAIWFDMTGTTINLKRIVHAADVIMITLNSRGASPSVKLEALKQEASDYGLRCMSSGTYVGTGGTHTNMIFAMFSRGGC